MTLTLSREVFTTMLEPNILTNRQGYMTVDSLIDLMGTGWLLTDLRLGPLAEMPMVIATLEQGCDLITVMVMEDGSIRDAIKDLI